MPAIAARRQRHERQDASFAVVVRTQHVNQILQRHDDHEGPENKRKNAENVVVTDGHGMRSEKTFLDGVEWTRADIPIDDAERRQAEKRDMSWIVGTGGGLHSLDRE